MYQEGSMLTKNLYEWNIRVDSVQILSNYICSVCIHMNFVNGLSIPNTDVLIIINKNVILKSEPLILNLI